MTLTNDHPTGSLPVGEATLAAAPPILALRITRVVNPGEIGVQIFVYLSYQREAGEKGTERQRILIANLGLFPPDRPAGFLLRASTAFCKLKAVSSNPAGVRLLLEMKRIHETKPWGPVEVTVAPPEWRSEDNK